MRIDPAASQPTIPAAAAPTAAKAEPAPSPAMGRDSWTPRAKVQSGGVGTNWRSHLPGVVNVAMLAVASGAKTVWNKLFGHEEAKDAMAPAERAKASMAALDAAYGLPGAPGLYRETPTTLKAATVWPHGQALAGAIDVAGLTGDYKTVDAMMAGLSLYEKNGAYAPGVMGGNRLWDDNAWIGLDFLQAYQQTGNPDYLKKTETLFPFFEQGLHRDGGLYWEENNPRMTRNTCGNGPAIEMALRLYMATKNEKYLDFAKNLDQFMNDKLRSPEGLYYDNMADNGELSKDIYSYNQGTPIGADVLWYRVTGDEKYLARATQTAKASLAYLQQDDRLWKGSPAFNAIYFRNLMALDQVAPDPSYRQALDQYLDRAWKEGRDPKTGLFNQGGIGRYEPGNILDQGGMAQLYALQAWPKNQLIDVA